MRKFFVGFLALLVSASLFAGRVTQEDAALVANNFMRSAASSAVKKAPAQKMVLKKAASAEENQYYVYENANGEGWVMVSASDIAHPILAYSETGKFRTDNQPANIRTWLSGYDRQIKRAEQDGLTPPESIQQEWRKLRTNANSAKATQVVGPLIQTGWDQDAPYWNKCPQKSGSYCYTGCVATAMAQVMNYHQWPKTGTGSHSVKVNSKTYTASFGETTYDWDNMLDTYGSSATSAQKDAVATLMLHCGIAVDMSYGTADEGGSGAYTIDYNGYFSGQGKMSAETALTQFFKYKSSTVVGYYRDGDSETGMRSWTKAEWLAMVKEELDANRPVMYAGTGCDDPSDYNSCYGHSFVCDGYDTNGLLHFNFGWSNWCDGNYDIDALETTDPGSGGGNGEYSLEQDVIVGIIPDRQDLPMITITWSVNGEETTSEIMQTDPLVLPENPENCPEGKVFVGWTAQSSITDGNAPSDLFKTAAGKTVTEAITYYAVFATADGEAGNVFDGTAGGTFKIYADVNGTKYFATSVSSNKLQSTTTEADATEFTFEKVTGGFTISNGTKYIVNTSNNTNIAASTTASNWAIEESTAGAGSWRVTSSNGRALAFRASTYNVFGAYSAGNINGTEYFDLEIGDAGSVTYSDYSLECGAPVVCELTGITLNTENVQKTFVTNAEFNSDNLVVTASYSNCSNKNVSSKAVVTAPDMTSAGEKTVEVSYEENGTTKTASYTIQVNDPATYTIGFYNNGELIGSEQTVVEGEQAEKPADPEAACDDYHFAGWFTAPLLDETETKPAFVTDFTATQDQNYYAIFSRVEEGSGSGSATFDGAGTYKIYGDVDGTKYYAIDSINPSNKLVTTTIEAEAAEFEFAEVTGGYSIKTGGKYLKYGSSTNVSLGTEAYAWGVEASTATSGSWIIKASGDDTRSLVLRVTSTFQSFGAYKTSNINGTEYFGLEIVGNGSASKTFYTSAPVCGPVVPCELESITLNTDDVQKTFITGTEFNYDNLVVTAHYTNCADKVVIAVVSVPNMNVAGEKTIEVSYTENEVTKTASYTINVNDPATFTIGFYNNGELIGSEMTVVEGTSPDLPSDVTAECDSYTFEGWFTEPILSETEEKPAFVTDFTATKDQNYYAIFSITEDGEGGSAFDGENGGTFKIYADVDGTKHFATTVSNSKLQSTTTEADATDFTFEKVDDGFTISDGTKYIVNTSTNTNISAAATASAWSVETGTNGSWRLTSTTGRALAFRASTFNVFGAYATSNITAEGTEYFDLEIVGNGSASKTFYTSAPACGPVVPCELESITLNTDDVQKTFITGTEFNYDNLVVTAHYTNCADKVVIAVVSVPNMNVAGEKTIEVSYTENEVTKTASYTIQVNDPATYTIGFYNNGELIIEMPVVEGTSPDLPSGVTAECDSYTFEGWFTEPILTETEEKPAFVTDFTATQDQNYYAIFSITEDGEGAGTAFDGENGGTFKIYADVDGTKHFATTVSNSKLQSTTTEADATEFNFEKVDDGFTISDGTKYIVNTSTNTNISAAATASAWSVETGTNGSWRLTSTTGRALAFRASTFNVFGAYATSNITAEGTEYFDLEIVGEGAASKTLYTSAPKCGETAIEDIVTGDKAIKVLENGIVVIIRDGARYTIFGQKIK